MKKNVQDLSGVYNLLDQDFNQRNITPVQNVSAFQVTSSESYTSSVNAAYTKPSRPVDMCVLTVATMVTLLIMLQNSRVSSWF